MTVITSDMYSDLVTVVAQNEMKLFNEIDIFKVQIAPLTVEELHSHIAEYVQAKQHHLTLHVNVHGLNLAYEQKWLREFLNQAALVFCDGAGVIWGAKILGRHIPQRITYADWMWQLAEFAAQKGFAFYFLGAKPGIVEQAAVRLKTNFPQLKIVGVHHGYFDKSHNSAENKAIIQQINAAQPDILIVGFGMPLQEQWLSENWEQINAHVALTGGAVFDYLSGELQRAPTWMTNNGLEWLGRLFIEPRRLWRRYIVGNPLFIWRVIKQKFGILKF